MRLKILLVGAVFVLSAGIANAASGSRAQTLFNEGRALLDDGATERACTKLAESARLEPKLVTKLALAGCYDRLGRTASAWSEFRDVAALAAKAGESEWTREAYALERVQALEKKLVRLVVTVQEPTPGLVVWRNDVPVSAAQLGVAVVVDPGETLIAATADGYEP